MTPGAALAALADAVRAVAESFKDVPPAPAPPPAGGPPRFSSSALAAVIASRGRGASAACARACGVNPSVVCRWAAGASAPSTPERMRAVTAWMGTSASAPPSSPAKASYWIAIADTHHPLHDPAAYACALAIIERARPDGVIHLGDIGEFESLSRFAAKARAQTLPLDIVTAGLRQDAEDVRAGLDQLDAVCARAGVRERVLCVGNHDARVAKFLESYPDPALPAVYALDPLLGLTARGWRIAEFGEHYLVGDVRCYHGTQASGIYHARTHCLRGKASYVYGHVHALQVATEPAAFGSVRSVSVPCLKRVDDAANPWLHRAPTAWSQGLAELRVDDRGITSVSVVEITGGRCWFRGELIDGNHAGVAA